MSHTRAVSEEPVRVTATVSGRVQGVGFRWSTGQMAQSLHLVGLAQNLPDGNVRVIAEGLRADCRTLVEWLYGAGPQSVHRPGRVDAVDVAWGPAEGTFTSFASR